MKKQSSLQKTKSRLEKYAGTNLSYLARGGSWLTSAKLVGFFTAFASSVVFANVLPEETYGNYRFFLTLIALFSLTTLPGMNTAVARATALGEEGIYPKAKQVKKSYGYLGSIIALITGLVYLTLFDNRIVFWGTLIMAPVIPFLEPTHLYHFYLNGKKDFKRMTAYVSWIRIITTIVLICTALLSEKALPLLVLYLVITLGGRLIFERKALPPSFGSLSDDTAQKHLRYGKRLSLLSFANEFSVYADKVLVYTLLSPALLAAYMLSFIPYKQSKNFLSSINTLALPKFSKNNLETLRATLPKKMVKLYLIIIPLIVLFWFVADPIFGLLYPKYPTSPLYAKFLMLQLLYFPFTLITTAFSALHQTKKLYITRIGGAVLRIAGIAVAVPLWGPLGAIGAILGARLCEAMISLTLFLKK